MFVYQIKSDNLVTRYEFSKRAAIAAMEELSAHGVCAWVDSIDLRQVENDDLKKAFEELFEVLDTEQVGSKNWD